MYDVWREDGGSAADIVGLCKQLIGKLPPIFFSKGHCAHRFFISAIRSWNLQAPMPSEPNYHHHSGQRAPAAFSCGSMRLRSYRRFHQRRPRPHGYHLTSTRITIAADPGANRVEITSVGADPLKTKPRSAATAMPVMRTTRCSNAA